MYSDNTTLNFSKNLNNSLLKSHDLYSSRKHISYFLDSYSLRHGVNFN